MKMEVIEVKQLPVIAERLEQIKVAVTEKVALANSLVCTEETVKEVKKARAELNSDFKCWEEKRKEVKTAIMSPYEQFEAVYKDCITNTYKSADADLKAKIDSVEGELKAQKENDVKAYFDEYLASREIDFVTFGDSRINVTLSASLKSLKESAKAYIDRIADDIALIETQENKAEILVEYKRSLNVSQAITTVSARIRAVEEEKARREAAEKAKQEAASIPKPEPVQPIKAPVSAPIEAEKEYSLTFRVTATKSKLRELKAFLDAGGYRYE